MNGRISMTELSEKVGLSKTPVLARVKKLEENGYILGYKAVLNYKKLNLGQTAFVQVHLDATTANALNTFNEAVLATPEIQSCHMIAGGFDYLLKIRAKDLEDYRKALGESIAPLPHYANSSTFMVIETVKSESETLM
jgi:Lrp/AsnC family leucine-responsive transcriptional regulator